ncbi:MAG: hypothetical protein HOP34_01475 [Methylococcaceae bacterium]|nr:hypothetical protein [Methylococcaceae bacterium]
MNAPQSYSNTAHCLYTLYETLPDTVQREFLSELWQKQRQQLEAIAADKQKKLKKNNRVIFGVMEGEFTVPDNFDDLLPETIENEFYTATL